LTDVPHRSEYGPVLGVTVPQANTTVEPEMQALLGEQHTLLTARMVCQSAASRERLLDYLDTLGATAAQFDVAPLQVLGFACTGSSYLVGAAQEAERLAALTAARGYPVLSAAQSILQALRALGARRIALLSPYPGWLSEAGLAYWKAAGLTVTAKAGLPTELLDTRNIYKLTTPAVQSLLAALDTSGCDAVLMSGTGMPSLGTMAEHRLPMPVLSSNLCLAWAMQCAVQPNRSAEALLSEMLAPTADWRRRL
jgi:maleate isomerase